MKLLPIILLFLLASFAARSQSVAGRVFSGGNGEPIGGATVTNMRLKRSVSSGADGRFSITAFSTDTLKLTAIGHEPITVVVSSGLQALSLRPAATSLDEALVIAYGTTTRRLSTGSVSKVTAAEIARQPVANPLAALQGRVPGLVVSQSNGIPGSGFSLQIRGRASLAQGAEPLIVVDGMPFIPGNAPAGLLGSIAGVPGSSGTNPGGLSPLAGLNPADIESIEVLRDADATAIYGSRGANGVLLITTRRGFEGKGTLQFDVATGWGRVTRSMSMLNTAQYLDMRREAFQNDGIEPDPFSAPDLLVWDTSRFTNFAKMLGGGTSRNTVVQTSYSGGTNATRFRMGAGVHHQGTVLPGNLAEKRASFSFGLNHAPSGSKGSVSLSAQYSYNHNNLVASNFYGLGISLPPNAPPLYDAEGKLNWQEGGVPFDNPLSALAEEHESNTITFLGALEMAYRLFPGLSLKASLGYNRLGVSELQVSPHTALNPYYFGNANSFASYANNQFSGWNIEPHVEYVYTWRALRLSALAGATAQQAVNESVLFKGNGYATDALLRSIEAAAALTGSSSFQQYHYAAGFGRLNVNWANRYILNLSGRRDASSRFGPGRRLANFGSVGGAWIFSAAKGVRNGLSFLSFGKLRGSWGTAGNDRIGNYQYLDAWQASAPGAGPAALIPARLFNEDYGWEQVRKAELGLELGLWSNRLLFNATVYRHRSSNQLINYTLPAQTGFTSIYRNFNATVQNSGAELSITAVPLESQKGRWTVTANLTMARNRLVSFPGIATSSYANTYVVGEPLSVIRRLRYTGVDGQTGLYTFEDVNKDGLLNSADLQASGHLDPTAFGGLGNTLEWKGWHLHLFFEGRKQRGTNYLASFLAVPGEMFNQPAAVLKRWQTVGDPAIVQRFTSGFGTPAYDAATLLANSDGIYGDASFVRLRTLSLSFDFPGNRRLIKGVEGLQIYLNAQNLLTLTRYKGADPETQNLLTLPPLRQLTTGVRLTL